MKIKSKYIFLCFLPLFVVLFGGSYYLNYKDSREVVHEEINEIFQKEASHWGEYILAKKGVLYRGSYNSLEYASKKKTTFESETYKVEISSAFHHPDSFNEYQILNIETFLLVDDKYDISITDSLFKEILLYLDVVAESSVELKIRDIREMFPNVDSLNQDAPFVKTIASGSVEGYTTQPVGVGICDHGMLYGHVKVARSEVLARMSWFCSNQLYALFFILVLSLLGFSIGRYLQKLLYYQKHTILIGNTCVDLPSQRLFLWDGECRNITETHSTLLQMLLDAAPEYKLMKEDVCHTLWNRSAKDGQALYNVAMTHLRNLFITEDPSLELKSIPKEGMQLLINASHIHRGRWRHFAWMYIKSI